MKSVIHTPTNNIKESLDFYTSLQFKVISDKDPTVVTDGKAIIEINPDRFARAGLKLYKNTWRKEVAELEKTTAVTQLETGHLLSDASGVWIYLVEGSPGFEFEPKESSFAVPGKFAGLSLETTDLARSASIWTALGFTNSAGNTEAPYIACVSEDGLTVSVMKPLNCPHLFFNPSLTYFNGGQNLPVIEKIRKAGIPISEEITYFNKQGIVDNIIIRDPGGYGFFVFND